MELQSLPSLAKVRNNQQINHSTVVVVELGLCTVRDILYGQETSFAEQSQNKLKDLLLIRLLQVWLSYLCGAHMEESPRPTLISICWLPSSHFRYIMFLAWAVSTQQHLTKNLCDNNVVLKHNCSGWMDWLELL